VQSLDTEVTERQWSEKDQEEWDRTEAALRVLYRMFDDLADRKPPKSDAPGTRAWEFEHREAELWAHSIGDRRFKLARTRR